MKAKPPAEPMKTVIFVSKSLDYSCVRDRSLNSSSQVFEYGLVSALDKLADMRILHLGSSHRELAALSGLNFCSINYHAPLGIFRLAKAIYDNRNMGNFCVVTTGYYSFEIATIVTCAKIFGGKSFSYIYDTHLTATQKMFKWKSTFADVYFAFGFHCARKLSGLLVLNDSFIKKRKFSVPFLKTKIGVESYVGGLVSKEPAPKQRRKVIIFAGTINAENGVELLIEFAKKNPNLGFELHFYGDGDRAGLVKTLAASDQRVRYFGRISDASLQEKLRAADLLLNLRDPECVACDYAFPSKLVHFMATGTPVMSNRFPGLDDIYTDYLYVVAAFDAESVGQKITDLLKHGIDGSLGVNARNFIEEQHRWSDISAELLVFMDKVSHPR